MILAVTAPLTPPTFDAAAAYPQVGEARAALAARDWPALRALVDAQDAYGRRTTPSPAPCSGRT